MTTTPDPTVEQIVAKALLSVPRRGNRIAEEVKAVVAALRAAGRLGGDPTEEPTREQRIALGKVIEAALGQCGISVTYALSGPAEMFDVAGIVLREYPALAAIAAAGVAPQEPSDRLDWKRRAETLRRKWMAAEERAQELFEKYAEHAEHVQVEAWSMDCIDGDCEHRDEDGKPEDLSACPSSLMEVCVDCMEIAGVGRDPKHWEAVLHEWPCEHAKPAPSPVREKLIAEARQLAAVSREMKHGAPSHADMIDALADALAAAPVVDGAKLAEMKARALDEAADAWLHGEWADTPRHADRVADRMGASQFAGDWMRRRAAVLRRGEKSDG